MSKRKPNWTDREKRCIVGGVREKKGYIKSKIFLIDNFCGQKQDMAGKCKYNYCREFSKKRGQRNTEKMGQYTFCMW